MELCYCNGRFKCTLFSLVIQIEFYKKAFHGYLYDDKIENNFAPFVCYLAVELYRTCQYVYEIQMYPKHLNLRLQCKNVECIILVLKRAR